MKMTRKHYAEMFGPTTGDLIRLGDTALFAEIERDLNVAGDEAVVGGGKTFRDGLAFTPGYTREAGAPDLVITNLTIFDPVHGVIKGDLGVRDGRIIGIGKAGNPDTMDGVSRELICGVDTQVIGGQHFIATAGAIDCHIHFFSPDLVPAALASGITTMIGGGAGPHDLPIDAGSAWNIARMLEAGEAWPVNIGYLARGNSSKPESLYAQAAGGAIGFKIHEDWGAMPAVIDTCLKVADELDIQVQLHTDTLNEAGFLEDTLAAINGRTIHMYHTEGAGGGHAPDIIAVSGVANCLTSSTNPTNPYTRNTFDEHLDMTITCHHLNPAVPEDVAFAESRIRKETIAAEDVLHDIGAISMMGSDAMGMGRIHEVVCRTWQLASKMRQERGRLPTEKTERADNERIKRYLAKYTINVARTFGIDAQIGSLEVGKLADITLWRPAFFGIKPEFVLKNGFLVWGAMGDATASTMWAEPRLLRPLFGAHGKAPQSLGVNFVAQAAIDDGLGRKLGLGKLLLPVKGTRKLNKSHMLHNDALPKVTVNPETFEVFVDGKLATCQPAYELPLTQRYMLR
jgi:urease subunit alpha